MMVGRTGGLAAIAMAMMMAMMMIYMYTSSHKPSTELTQEGIFTPGLNVYEVPKYPAARTQSLIQGQVAMGAMGGADGLHPVPSPGPPTWERGGNTWMYDRIYGNGIRPTTGVWAQPTAVAEEPQGEQGEEAAPEGGATEPAAAQEAAGEEVPAAVEEAQGPAVEAEAAPAAEPQNDAAVAEAAAAPQPRKEVVQEVVEPDGEVKQKIEPKAEAAESAADDCEGGDCGQNPDQIIVNVPSQQAPVQQVPVPYPAPASQQLPMEWAAEDAAEHAYNLAQWRVKILKAKMEQAKLRKELMAVTMGDDSEDTDEVARQVGSRGRRAGRSDVELKAVKMSLLTLAKETVSAIRQLKNQMQALRSSSLRRGRRGGKETQLADVGGSQMNRALQKIKAKKTAEVLQLKKKMDNQLNALLQKVTKLIKSKPH